MNVPPIGFAVIGTGMIAEVHAQAIKDTPEARLAAVWTRSAENRNAFAAKFGCRAAESLEALVADPEIRAVTIATPSGAHADVAVPFLEAGKAVLCEKPLEVSLDAVDRIVAAAKRGGGTLAGVFQMRLQKAAQTVKHAVEAGRFGRLTSCSAYIKWWRSHEYYSSSTWKGSYKLDGGGALINQGIHAVDLLQWIAGLPEEVSAFSARLSHVNIEAEDTVAAVLRYPHGGLGVIEAATSAWPGDDVRIEIVGDRGSATLINDRLTRWVFADELPEDEAIRQELSQGTLKVGSGDPRGMSWEGHQVLISDLSRALLEGRPPMIPGQEARRAVQLVLAIYESAKTGRTVRL
ncbi:MAG TPA: Gfo/Idh/MocA family oxidoreductase [Chthoniobacter sp.]|nr:Gfo/Idh/MocA family oxidoreductase [Chthoniobacter sp.]